jgi:4-hydroxybenzoate polyprenyltransferase
MGGGDGACLADADRAVRDHLHVDAAAFLGAGPVCEDRLRQGGHSHDAGRGGERSTRRQMLVYTILLLPVTLLPWWIGGTGAIYGVSACVLSGLFLLCAIRVAMRRREGEEDRMVPEKQMFAFSVFYLFALFGALVADRWLGVML